MIKIFTRDQSSQRIGKYFTAGELFIHPGLSTIRIDTNLIDALDKMHEHFGKTIIFPSINSLYRTSATNAACGGAKSSQHLKGKAVDFRMDGVDPVELARYAEKIGMGGIGVYKNCRHIHMDTRPGKICWWLVTSGSRTPGFGGVAVTFKVGHRSPAIKDIQDKLNILGYLGADGKKLSEDGEFGANTQFALKAYQRNAGLKADGTYGRKTNAAMGLFDW